MKECSVHLGQSQRTAMAQRRMEQTLSAEGDSAALGRRTRDEPAASRVDDVVEVVVLRAGGRSRPNV